MRRSDEESDGKENILLFNNILTGIKSYKIRNHIQFTSVPFRPVSFRLILRVLAYTSMLLTSVYGNVVSIAFNMMSVSTTRIYTR